MPLHCGGANKQMHIHVLIQSFASVVFCVECDGHVGGYVKYKEPLHANSLQLVHNPCLARVDRCANKRNSCSLTWEIKKDEYIFSAQVSLT